MEPASKLSGDLQETTLTSIIILARWKWQTNKQKQCCGLLVIPKVNHSRHTKSLTSTVPQPTSTTDDFTFLKMERTAALKNNKKKIERNRNGVMMWQQCHNHFTHLHSILKTSSCGQQWGDNWCQCQCSCMVREVTASSHACTVGLFLEKKKIFDYSNHLLTIKTWITDAYFFHMNI